MSSAYGRPAATTGDRPQYPDLKEEIGEDPARYLHEPDGTTWARIRGITSLEVLDAWIGVADDLDCSRRVRKRLYQRHYQLEENSKEGDA